MAIFKVKIKANIRYRALVARGEERRGKPGPQPGAANMRQMVRSLSYPTKSYKKDKIRLHIKIQYVDNIKSHS